MIDSSRSDWWLAVPIASGNEGWVPANYLEPITGGDDPTSPPPDPFEDEAGELQRLMMKQLTQSELSLNRRQLYKSSFLEGGSRSSMLSKGPSDAQLNGVSQSLHFIGGEMRGLYVVGRFLYTPITPHWKVLWS